jgi:hypothetical protein
VAGQIKDVFVNDDALHVVRGSEVWRLKNKGKEPSRWERVQFTDGGASEELVEFLEASAVYILVLPCAPLRPEAPSASPVSLALI